MKLYIDDGLIAAIQSEDVGRIESTLSRAGIDINRRYAEGLPLSVAVGTGNVNVTKLLLDHGANVDEVGSVGWTTFRSQVTDASLEILGLLLDYGADINALDDTGMTPLMQVVSDSQAAREYGYYARHIKTLEFLLEHGATVDLADARGYTALAYGAIECAAEEIELLIQAGADANAPEEDGWTPLMWAVRNHCPEVAKLLLAHGAHINHPANDGRTVLMLGGDDERFAKVSEGQRSGELYDRHIEIVKLLVNSGADVNATGADGFTPDIGTANILIASGADVNATGPDGWTALMWASKESCEEVVRLLMQAGADPGVQVHDGDSTS